MDTPTILVIAGVVLLAVIVLWALRQRRPERPSGQESPDARGAGKSEPRRPEARLGETPRLEPSRADAPLSDAEPAERAKVAEPDSDQDRPAERADAAPPEEREPREARAADARPGSADASSPPQTDGLEKEGGTPKSDSARPANRPEGLDQVTALKRGLASTRGGFIARLARIFGGRKEIDPALLDQVQEVLITADVGVRTSDKMLDTLRAKQKQGALRDDDAVWEAIRDEARSILGKTVGGVRVTGEPTVILVVGVNGVGKTTTIGKLASRFQEDGRKVILAAGDTFRAAAVLQLEVWGRRVGCGVVKGKDRADPASVIFDAIKRAREDGADVVLADTAGRLHTKINLMEELKKVVRTAEKALERPIDEILLVLDSTTGQNAIQQAELFKSSIPISGIVLTKLDGTAKGGVVLGIVDTHRIPVRYIGIGERIEDLREFDTDTFVSVLFAKPDDETAAA